jgi:hypothetical protein
MPRRFSLIAGVSLTGIAAMLLSCATSNPNLGRVLVSISVTPPTADAQTFSNGQVVFTANGTFNLPPSPAPVSSAAPYSGQFVVDNPDTGPIATIIATGIGTATVQCVAGASGIVLVSSSASANNGSNTTISGSAQLTCP